MILVNMMMGSVVALDDHDQDTRLGETIKGFPEFQISVLRLLNDGMLDLCGGFDIFKFTIISHSLHSPRPAAVVHEEYLAVELTRIGMNHKYRFNCCESKLTLFDEGPSATKEIDVADPKMFEKWVGAVPIELMALIR